MKKFYIIWEDAEGKVWSVGGLDGIEAVSMRAASEMFWSLWTTTLDMPKRVEITEGK